MRRRPLKNKRAKQVIAGGAQAESIGLTPAMEDYVEAIFALTLRKGTASVSDIAAARGVRVPTASEAVAQLQRKGLVTHQQYGDVELTEVGREVATRLRDRRQLLSSLFCDVLALPRDLAEAEACRLEHQLTQESVEKIRGFVNRHGRRVPLSERTPARGRRRQMAEVAERVVIDEERIFEILRSTDGSDAGRVREIIAKALELRGLDDEDVAVLADISDPELLGELFAAARRVKEAIYGPRLVLFAPLYISNLCANECLYCAFRARNTQIKRRALTQEEIARETKALIDQGHKRVLLVAGESYPQEGFSYILKSIETVYSVQSGRGRIRRLNVNIAPLSVEEFRELKATGIGTYQIFQETYHRDTYRRMHVGGKKRDYDYRITAPDRAMEAGIDDVGIGVLFGLFDWRFEILALLQHIRHLEAVFGVGPHTISVPRLEPAVGSDIASHPPYPVSDIDFRKIVAILRLAVPYTGMIMSTRETANLRRETFALGISQISAGSRTNPGGYTEEEELEAAQFQLGDHRPLDEVVRDVALMGYTPSFCTACYRIGRTGEDFMALAKPGEIKEHCGPNALATFLEYLLDYASPETRRVGEQRIAAELATMEGKQRAIAERLLDRVRAGERDVYC